MYLRGVKHPEAFHGVGKKNGFFEGWYVKLVSADQSQRWAVIPGIFRGLSRGDGDEAGTVAGEGSGSGSGSGSRSTDVAFVQVLDGKTGRSWFHEFDVANFEADTKSFKVRVGDNHFDAQGVTLNLPQLKGRIEYSSPIDPWPVTLASPGIMGWYGLVPFMECFHGIVSFGHGLAGNLEVEGAEVDFAKGRGYIEKDWGRGFPAGYIWMQTNHFATAPNASLIASVAIIPWLGSAFRGYIIGFKHSGKLHKWTTYNKSHEQALAIDDTHVRWAVTGPDGTLEISGERAVGGLLHAPLRSAVHQRVEETMLATVSVRHLDVSGAVIFEDAGTSAAMEVFGDLPRLLSIRR